VGWHPGGGFYWNSDASSAGTKRRGRGTVWGGRAGRMDWEFFFLAPVLLNPRGGDSSVGDHEGKGKKASEGRVKKAWLQGVPFLGTPE